jgi:PAS domain S-box-containing protein
MFNRFQNFLKITGPDSEDVRRCNLLNILLAGSFFTAIVIILLLFIGILTKLWTFSDATSLIVFLVVFCILISVIFIINRRWGWLATFSFILLLIIGYAFSDSPVNISNGNSVFFYALPIVMASLLIRPWTSFVVAMVGCGIITWGNTVAYPGCSPNFIIMFGFLMLALISWLASRSLETALRDLRKININLDQLVQERTLELSNALQRERMEAGRSKAILESIADGMIVFDTNGTAIIVNASSAQLLDLKSDELVGKKIDDFSLSHNLKPEFRQMLQKILTNPGSQYASSHVEWGKRTLSVTSALVNDTEGVPIGSVAVFRDYSHEAELDRMKNTFLAIVSHELRTPLNAILGYSEMIKESVYGPVNEKQARASERIMTNSKRLLDIVSDLLDHAQMEAGSWHCIIDRSVPLTL